MTRFYMSWPNLTIITGGLLMSVLWIIYTYVHGPTSFDRTRSVLGQSTLFWGSMMNAPGSILISLGLLAQYALLAGNVDRRARIGFVLTLIGLALQPWWIWSCNRLDRLYYYRLLPQGSFCWVSATAKTPPCQISLK